MKYFLQLFLFTICLATAGVLWSQHTNERAAEERLTFQTHQPWSARINLNADVAMNYGIDASLPSRMETWRQHGYRTEVMTGVAWGQYQDYLDGKYDGKSHWDDAQTERDGSKILHGGSKDVPYISPGQGYGRYLTVGVKRALDAGAQAIYLEEPEFWARGGYSDGFKQEWQAYYHEPWEAPDSSVNAQYRASKLKYFLYRRALSQVFKFVKEYGRQHGRVIPCYVPTHSLINYAHWRIVSPESSLLDVGADGYIAQVWTGTARTPNIYEGRRRERTFETAFLEYGAMQNLVRASGRRLWYLNDPIEDNPNHNWEDYRTNWESTLTASLLQPEVWRYEIMPWPERIFNGRYPVKNVAPKASVAQLESKPLGTGLGGFGRSTDVERVGIPKSYETELQAVITALGDMKQPPSEVKWGESPMQGVGVLVSDTMMFQRADPTPSDANLGSFYGLALPLLKRGVPIEPVQVENAASPGFLKRYRLLLLTYEGQKPPTPEFHQLLAQWVRDGGALVVVDDDRDPYLKVREWWNTGSNRFPTPREQLFDQLGISKDARGIHQIGRGVVIFQADSPSALTYKGDGADKIRELATKAAAGIGLSWKESNALVLRRGPYVVAAGLDESVPGLNSVVLHGRFVNLFNSELPEESSVTLLPGSRVLLFDLDTVKNAQPEIVAAACRITNEQFISDRLSFRAEGIGETNAVVRIKTTRKPSSIQVDGVPFPPSKVKLDRNTLALQFENSAKGIQIEIDFRR
jgi:hypothetical protein